jgi:hypothetical protein
VTAQATPTAGVPVASRAPEARTAVIVQSNYIPWKGYFDLINLADELILLDDVQYTRRDWRNRNLIKTPAGLQWLTIPVEVKGKYHQEIRHTRISDRRWAHDHWASLLHNYTKAAGFRDYRDAIEPLYRDCREESLSEVNLRFIAAICSLLGIRTRITWSWEHPHGEGRNERLLSLCKSVAATRYLSGPSARGYLDEALFVSEGVEVAWMDYGGYPEYGQLNGKFEHGVSVLDLIFNAGRDAPLYMKSFAQRGGGRQHA